MINDPFEAKKTTKPVLTVSQLNQQARQLLEKNFPLVLIEGEISNLRKPSSGHYYFSLKDPVAQVRCAMFRLRSNLLPFELKDGMHVLVQAKLSLYEERGDFQLIVQNIEEAGDGALRRAFEQLKQRLAQEGLFEASHKKALPTLPRCVGVITSATGAAIQDILNVLKRRFAALPVIIYPTQVQGNEAAGQIVNALRMANLRRECDVLILARGGGSLEDLWPFNEEIVARAIYQSDIPIVSGVGHEIDFTIADFVADQRAPTPSAAAELISPNLTEFLQKLQFCHHRIFQIISTRLQQSQQKIQHLNKRLRHPNDQLLRYAQRLDYIEHHLRQAHYILLQHKKNQLENLANQLQQYQPLALLKQFSQQRDNLLLRLKIAIQIYFQKYAYLENIQQRLQNCMQIELQKCRQTLHSTSQILDTVSPLRTLQRGYAIATIEAKVLSSIKMISVGEKISVRLNDGQVLCSVLETQDI